MNKQAEAEAQEILRDLDASDNDAVYMALVKHITIFVGLAKHRSMPLPMQRHMLDETNRCLRVFEVSKDGSDA